MQRRDKNTMKISITSILLCSLLIGCTTSQADEITQKPIPAPQQETQQNVRPYGQAFVLTKNVVCNDSKVIYSIIKTEPDPQIPIFFGLIKNEHGATTMMAQIFINKKNNKFSIVESSTQGISCVISDGFDFDILPHLHSGEFQKRSNQEVNKKIYKLPQKIRMKN